MEGRAPGRSLARVAALPVGSGKAEGRRSGAHEERGGAGEESASQWGEWRYGLSVLHAENIHPQAAGTELLIQICQRKKERNLLTGRRGL